MARFGQWMIGVAIIALSGAGAFVVLSPSEADRLRMENAELERRQNELQAELIRQQAEFERRQAQMREAIERLSAEQRVAEVWVVDQVQPGEMLNGKPADHFVTTIEFIELDRDQNPLPSKRFQICDDVLFFDALVFQFDAERVAAGDALRGKSLALFRRIYGEHQKPGEGFAIDPEGDVPNVFRINPEPNEFERELWDRFWDYASDLELAEEAGVRVAQGEAVYVPMRRGQVWKLTLQNNGGLNIKLRRSGAEATSRPASSSPR